MDILDEPTRASSSPGPELASGFRQLNLEKHGIDDDQLTVLNRRDSIEPVVGEILLHWSADQLKSVSFAKYLQKSDQLWRLEAGSGVETRLGCVMRESAKSSNEDRKSTRLNSSHLGISYA